MNRLKIGSVLLDKKYCPSCEDYSLVNPDDLSCFCGTLFQVDSKIAITLIGGKVRKHTQKQTEKIRTLLSKQLGKCYWCNRDISTGFYIYIRNRPRKLRAVLDHRIPYKYCQDNHDLVVSCDRCNSYKHDTMVYDEDKMRDFILSKWNKDISRGKISELMEVKNDKIIQFDSEDI